MALNNSNSKNVRNGSKSRKSILRGTDNYVAQTVPIVVGDDTFRFDIRELSPEATAAIEAWAPTLAIKLGCDADIAADKEALSDWIDDNRTELLENGKSLSENITANLEGLWDISLSDAVVDWDLDEPFSKEDVLRLPRAIKSKLHAAITVGSTLGEGAEEFFRRRATATNNR